MNMSLDQTLHMSQVENLLKKGRFKKILAGVLFKNIEKLSSDLRYIESFFTQNISYKEKNLKKKKKI